MITDVNRNHLIELQVERELNKQSIKEEEWRLNREFHAVNKRLFFWCDVLMIMALLFNFGAVSITNAMVVKNTPTLVVHESNPAQVAVNGYATKPGLWKQYYGMIAQWLMYAVLFFIYIQQRSNTKDRSSMFYLMFIVGFVFIVTGFDFFNDFGYLIGKLLWGA